MRRSTSLAVIPAELHHSYGKTIAGDLVVRPIPRGLWADKPATANSTASLPNTTSSTAARMSIKFSLKKQA